MTDLTLIGGLPPPFGGVAEFLLRLSSHSELGEIRVVDLYRAPPGQRKRRPGGSAEVVTMPVRRAWTVVAFLLLVREIFVSRARHYFFNFSTPRSLWLIALLPKQRGSKWNLMLHNGQLTAGAGIGGRLLRRIGRRVLSRFDTVFCMNQNQHDFYRSSGVDDGRLVWTSSYIFDKLERSGSRRRGIPWFDSTKTNIVLSGYPDRNYNFDFAFDFLEERPDRAARLVFHLCVYGSGDEEYVRSLRRRVLPLGGGIKIYRDLAREDFWELLTRSQIYVRPTFIDSFGIACADAKNLGLDVLASDVCPRFPGVVTYAAEDKGAGYLKLDEMISRSSSSGPASAPTVDDDLARFAEVFAR